jgi:uncharacterized SAM-dependent methyltransferase
MHAAHERAAPAAAARAHPSPFARDVLDGLARRRRSIPGTWLFDRRGTQLLDEVAAAPEYYPARTEAALVGQCAALIADEAGPQATLVELCVGTSRTTPILLAALERPADYLSIHIGDGVDALAGVTLPEGAGRRIVFLPSDAIGRLTPEAASVLLESIGRLVGLGALLVVGADHTRDPGQLLGAYLDRAGASAALNKNLLERINRELDGDFDAQAFRHAACFNPAEPRVELYLVAQRAQRVSVLGQGFDFAGGESIHTGNAYKPSLFQFLALAHRAGWAQRQLWMGAAAGYAVHVLENVLTL